MDKQAVLEGVLFVVGEEGLTFDSIQKIMNIDTASLHELIDQYKKELENPNRGMRLVLFGDKYKLATKPEHFEYYQRIKESSNEFKFSNASLETLAIIAYNQPITRLEVENKRGVNCDHIIRRLMSYSLIKEAGQKDTVGRPMMYEVTHEFLDLFNLTSIDQLPELNLEEFEEEEKNIFNTRFTKEDNDGENSEGNR